MKRNDRAVSIIAAALCLVAALASGCAQGIRVAQPLQFAEDPSTLSRENLSIAVVRDPKLARMGKDADPGLVLAVGDAVTRGLAEATRAVASKVEIVEPGQTSGYDLVITPANFYLESGAAESVDISMDITIRRQRDGKEFGILAEGSGGPGPRPIERFERGGKALNISGVSLGNGPYGRALNNAIFHLVMDYLKKLDHRMESLR